MEDNLPFWPSLILQAKCECGSKLQWDHSQFIGGGSLVSLSDVSRGEGKVFNKSGVEPVMKTERLGRDRRV